MELMSLIYSYEILLTVMTQNSFQSFEYIFVFVSQHLGPSSIVDIIVPLFGALNMRLMIDLILFLGMVNILASVIKWITPGHRPYWWTKEFNGPEIRHHALTCETTTGFPSAHSMCFTSFVYTVALYLISKLDCTSKYLNSITIIIVLLLVLLSSCVMWYSRMYFGCHFLHQCVCGSLIGYLAVNLMNNHQIHIYEIGTLSFILFVLFVGAFVIGVYHLSKFINSDPLWSVQMGTKWCTNPNEIKLNSSPTASFARDFGLLFGIALSAPLETSEQFRLNLLYSLPCAVFWVLFNRYLKKVAPEPAGSTKFIIFEMFRNMMHSFFLITIFPRLCYAGDSHFTEFPEEAF